MNVRTGHGSVLWLDSQRGVDAQIVAMQVRNALLDYGVPVLCIDPAELGAVVAPSHLPNPTRREIRRSILVQTTYLAVREGTVVIIVAGPSEAADRDRVRGGVPAFVHVDLQRSNVQDSNHTPPLPAARTTEIDLDTTPASEVVLKLLKALNEPRQHTVYPNLEPVGQVMNLISVFLRPGDPMARAKELVRRTGVRHLPVFDNDAPVGMVSLTDLYALECLAEANLETVPVRDVMVTEVLSLEASTPIRDVARQMAQRRVGSAVITRDGKPVGIFTASNASWVLGYQGPKSSQEWLDDRRESETPKEVQERSALN